MWETTAGVTSLYSIKEFMRNNINVLSSLSDAQQEVTFPAC